MYVESNWAATSQVHEWFSAAMLGKMAANTHKGWWVSGGMTRDQWIKRIEEELQELKDSKRLSDDVLECADISNICMMMADCARRNYAKT